MKTIKVVKKSIKGFVVENRQRILIATMLLVVGIIIGVIVNLSENSDYNIYSSDSLSLYDIITNDYERFELFFDDLLMLLLAIAIIFILSYKSYTFFLTFIYVGFQGFLFGASITGLIVSKGLSGVLNAIFFLMPVNFINFVAIITTQVLCWQRLSFSKNYKISTIKSIKTYLPKFIFIILLCIISAIIYGLIYPLLLRSVVVINY